MKISDTNTSFNTNAEIDSHKFTIENSSKAFQILSKNIYEDPISAIIRELCCNAMDAHTAAGIKDPIDVYLPTTANGSIFKVKDYGIGMSDEFVTKMYSSYFVSEKTSSNEMIGGLGLGSKTPFAYTNSFKVKSCKNGILNTYIAFKDEQNIPSITKILTEKCENSGTEIELKVNSQDFYKFFYKARTIFMFFPQIPNIVSGKKEFYNSVSEEEYLNKISLLKNRLVTSDRFFSDINEFSVTMGGVNYRVKADHRDKMMYPGSGCLVKKTIPIPIGSVDIQPSREGLNYTERTVKFINSVFLEDYNKTMESTKKVKSNSDLLKWFIDTEEPERFLEITDGSTLPTDFLKAYNKRYEFFNSLKGRCFKMLSTVLDISSASAQEKNILFSDMAAGKEKIILLNDKYLKKLEITKSTPYSIKSVLKLNLIDRAIFTDAVAAEWINKKVRVPVIVFDTMKKPGVKRTYKNRAPSKPEFFEPLRGCNSDLSEIQNYLKEGKTVLFSIKHRNDEMVLKNAFGRKAIPEYLHRFDFAGIYDRFKDITDIMCFESEMPVIVNLSPATYNKYKIYSQDIYKTALNYFLKCALEINRIKESLYFGDNLFNKTDRDYILKQGTLKYGEKFEKTVFAAEKNKIPKDRLISKISLFFNKIGCFIDACGINPEEKQRFEKVKNVVEGYLNNADVEGTEKLYEKYPMLSFTSGHMYMLSTDLDKIVDYIALTEGLE